MKLSHVGIIADILWNEIKTHAKNIELGEYVVMPNHVHGILVLNGNTISKPGQNTLSSIIGSYKSAVTRHAHRLGYEFAWQARFHDHIIRNEGEYQRIAEYIKANPAKWNEDKFYKYLPWLKKIPRN